MAIARREKKMWPALKHGAYAVTAVLPGEDRAAFEKLHRDLIAEFAPDGVFECDIIGDLARLMWRKRNMTTLRLAEIARIRYQTIENEKMPRNCFDDPDFEKKEATRAAAVEEARTELGPTFMLVELGDLATLDHQARELQVEERFNAVIDKCLRRLLYVRGLKSMSVSPSNASKVKRLG
jgi:hypothetical protein